MQGLMMDYPLTLQHFYSRAVRLFPRKEIVTQTDSAFIATHSVNGVNVQRNFLMRCIVQE